MLSSLLTLAVTVLLAVAVWEAVNAAIERHLARLAREAQAARSARLRTLLPLLRTTLSITIVIVAGMMVLSEIGVNIGPLLAGAGIVGVAIGFGSQKLVQDLITGIFLLLENAMQVGDSVTVVRPDGHGGEPVGPHHPPARRRRLGAHHPVQLGDHGDQREPRAGQRVGDGQRCRAARTPTGCATC